MPLFVSLIQAEIDTTHINPFKAVLFQEKQQNRHLEGRQLAWGFAVVPLLSGVLSVN